MQKKKSQPKALLVGAVVYDALFQLSSSISDQIVVTGGKPGWQNLMFSARDKELYFGGPSGNIAYGLALLGEKPILASIAGRDFADYKTHLKKLNIESRVVIVPENHTAMFYGMIDTLKQQMGVFQGNSYHTELAKFPVSILLKKSDWNGIAVGIFSPGTAKSIVRDMKEFKAAAPAGKSGAAAILDPGQMLAVDFTPELFAQALRYTDILILNDFEAHFLETKLGFTHERLWKAGLKAFIVTQGEKGSTLYTLETSVHVKPHTAKKVIDPTGAGDAFRAGLIHGLLSGKSIIDSMEIGSRLGAKCVAQKGGQTYKL